MSVPPILTPELTRQENGVSAPPSLAIIAFRQDGTKALCDNVIETLEPPKGWKYPIGGHLTLIAAARYSTKLP